MKFLLLFLLSFFLTCAQAIKEPPPNLSKEQLIKKVLSELSIEELKTDFIVADVSPNNPDETIIVIPEVVNARDDGESYDLNGNIVIIDNKTNQITHKIVEKVKENGWISDAIYIDKITIDANSYNLNNNLKKAFGVTVHFRSFSQPNPYSSKIISLYTKKKNKLVKILDNYPLYESSGVVNVNMNACYSAIKNTINDLSMSDSMTNKVFDILIKRSIYNVSSYKHDNGECNTKKTLVSTENHLLKFNGENYK